MEFLDIINIPMGYVIRFCNNIVGNQYLFALFIFAIIVEILMLPMGIKQQKNTIKQSKMRPKEMAIRKKYEGRNDAASKQKLQEEIQALYQKEGYNPASGCLPLLIQFPIIIALYNIVLNPLRFICRLSTDAIGQLIPIVKSYPTYAASNFDTKRTIELMDAVKEIIDKDGVGVFSNVEGFSDKIGSAADLPNLILRFSDKIELNLASTPDIGIFNLLLIIPVLTFAAYFASMKVSRKLTYQPTVGMDDKAMGCSNKIMDYCMPLMSVFISFQVPAAIGVYWIFKSLLGMVKQIILHFAMPLPSFSEEDYKAAENEIKARADKQPRRSSGGNVRSLHHIDDDDYADTAVKPKNKPAEKPATEGSSNVGEENNISKASKLLGEAQIKDDARKKDSGKSGKNDAEDN